MAEKPEEPDLPEWLRKLEEEDDASTAANNVDFIFSASLVLIILGTVALLAFIFYLLG